MDESAFYDFVRIQNGCYRTIGKQYRPIIVDQFICLLERRAKSVDDSGSNGKYGDPISLRLPLECHQGVRHNYLGRKRFHMDATR